MMPTFAFLMALSPATAPPRQVAESLLTIVGAGVVDPSAPARPGATNIVIRGNRIAAVGPADEVPVPSGSRVIDARGRFVIPGLADLHYHLPLDGAVSADHPAFQAALRAGVTTLLLPGVSTQQIEPLRALARSDSPSAPRLVLALGFVTARNGYASMADPAFTPETEAEARAVVRDLARRGVETVKITYSDNSYLMTRPFPLMRPEVMRATVAEAHALGLRAIVHAPELANAKEALRAGADALAHAVADRPVDAEFLELLLRSGAAYMSTSGLFESFGGLAAWLDRVEAFDIGALAPRSAVAALRAAGSSGLHPSIDKVPFPPAQRRMIAANLQRVARAGGRILLGTDTSLPGLFPGLSVHLELALHVEAGLEPAAALRAATIDAARFLGREREFGSIEVGKIADLVILDADPLAAIGNTRRIHAVLRGGRVVER